MTYIYIYIYIYIKYIYTNIYISHGKPQVCHGSAFHRVLTCRRISCKTLQSRQFRVRPGQIASEAIHLLLYLTSDPIYAYFTVFGGHIGRHLGL